MNKYSVVRVASISVLLTILQNAGHTIFTFQFWLVVVCLAVYGCAFRWDE